MSRQGTTAWWLAVPLSLAVLSLLDHGRRLPPHQAEWLEAGDTISIQTPGGGGWGKA